MADPQRRQAFFTFADARGNNPHGTSEDAVREAHRLNAQRYETVEQMAARFDSRAGPVGETPSVARLPMTSGEMVGWAIGLGLLGAAAFMLLGSKKKDEIDEPVLGARKEPIPNPSPPSPSPVTSTVVVNPPMLALPAPAPVVEVTVKAARKRKRAKKVEVPVVTTSS